MTTKPKLHPLGKRVLVQRATENNVTSGGIVIPETAKADQKYIGTVVCGGYEAIAEDGTPKEQYPNLKNLEGKRIYFQRGMDLSIDDVTYVIVESEDILGVEV